MMIPNESDRRERGTRILTAVFYIGLCRRALAHFPQELFRVGLLLDMNLDIVRC